MEQRDIAINVTNSWERTFIETQDAFIKGERSKPEITPFWAKERLQNEFATIQYIATHTTIPVPQCQLSEKDGLLYLKTARMDGVPLSILTNKARSDAIKVVDKQIRKEILPQLQSIRRSYIGSVDPILPVFPPLRVYGLDRRPWEQKSSATGLAEFVLCHTDLAPGNILVNPTTYRITGILDWEFAGFYPEYFELPLWTAADRDQYGDMCRGAKMEELAFWGLKPADMKRDV